MNETPRELTDEELSLRNTRAVNARWNFDRRAANIKDEIGELIAKAEADLQLLRDSKRRDHGPLPQTFGEYFSQADRIKVYKLMGGQTKKKG